MKQQTLAMEADQEAAFANYRKPTQRDEFLKTMECAGPEREAALAGGAAGAA